MSLSKLRILIHQYLAVIFGNIINISFGTSFAWFILNSNDLMTEKSPLMVPPLAPTEVVWIGISQYIGAVVGTIFLSMMGIGFGRKNTLAVMVIPQLASTFLITFSTNATELYIARFLSGYTGGGTVILMALFTTEICEFNPNGRGTLLSILPLSLASGFLIEHITHIFLTYDESTYVTIGLCFAFLICFSCFWDSPRQLCSMAHKQNEAAKALNFYRIESEHINSPLPLDNYYEVKKIRHRLRSQKVTRRDFAKLPALKATIISVILVELHCLCSAFFTNHVVLDTLYSDTNQIASPTFVNVLLGAAAFVGIFSCTILVDVIGRKPILLGSTICSALGFLLLGTQYSIGIIEDSYLDLCLYCFISLCLCCGVIPLVYILIPEIFSEKIRSINVTIAFSVVWFTAIFLVYFGDSLITSFTIAEISYFLSGQCVISAVCFMIILPETKKKTYEEIVCSMEG